jgi:predicted nucleic acid-binding Zn ribbon protein
MMHEHPFEILGIAPTLDARAIKRAYFARLAQTPPHIDPQGFRRLRAAYELLQQPQSLRVAWLSAPLETGRALAAWEQQHGHRLAAATAESTEQTNSRVVVDEFIRWLTRLRFDEARQQGDERT